MLPIVRSALWIAALAVLLAGCSQPAPAPAGESGGDQASSTEQPTATTPSGTWQGTIDAEPLTVSIDGEGNLTWKQGDAEQKGRARFEGDSVYFLFDSGGGLLLEQNGAELTGEYREGEESEPQKVSLSRQESE